MTSATLHVHSLHSPPPPPPVPVHATPPPGVSEMSPLDSHVRAAPLGHHTALRCATLDALLSWLFGWPCQQGDSPSSCVCVSPAGVRRCVPCPRLRGPSCGLVLCRQGSGECASWLAQMPSLRVGVRRSYWLVYPAELALSVSFSILPATFSNPNNASSFQHFQTIHHASFCSFPFYFRKL